MQLTQLLRDFLSNFAAELIVVALLGVGGLVLGWMRRRKLTRLADEVVSHGKLTRAPNGYRSAWEHEGEIYVTDQHGLRNITHHPARDMGPLWSPDSQFIAFISNRDNNDWEIYVWHQPTQRLGRLTRMQGMQRPVGWDEEGNLQVNFGGSYWTIRRSEMEKALRLKT